MTEIAVSADLCIEDLHITRLLLEDAMNKGIWQFEELKQAMSVHKKIGDLIDQFNEHVKEKL